ncbi:phenylacetate 2-hydroxylase, partial [Aureobasidium melanogenum]
MASLEHLSDVLRMNSVYIAGAASICLVVLLVSWAYGTDIKHIKGIPEIPGALPVFGHLLKLGEDHASSCEKWWRQYNQPVFQIKLGNTRAVVFNSFDACRDILVKHHNAVIDRPKLYTFHGVISSTQGFTIGSSPWDSSCKNKRKAAGTALSRPAMRNYHPMFDLESFCIIRDMHKDSNFSDPNKEISIRPYIQRYALNTTLTLCYGIRMDDTYDELLREILHVGSAISLLRSASENMQDYVPALRYLPNNEKNVRSQDLRSRRDAYLNLLLDKVREMIKNGTDKPCISAAILKDEETKLTGVEVSSICLSLVSGGFETIPGTLTSCLGSLCTPEGQIFQERAYADIKRHYPDIRDAWQNSFQEEKVPYLKAIIQEAGRYYTVSSMSLPRRTVTEVNWNGAIIPPKTMILVNAQAGNHDVDHFGSDAAIFNPERWLEPITKENDMGPFEERVLTSQAHLSFGAGTRACSGQLIATRLLYSALIRILSSYKIVASESEPPNTDYVDYNQFKTALVAIPRDFKVRLIPRDKATMEDCMQSAYERTKEHYKEDINLAEQDHDSATYPVAFVRSLEERVRELEQQQAFLTSRDAQVEGPAQLGLSTTLNLNENANEVSVEDTGLIFSEQHISDHGNHVVHTGQSPVIDTNHGSAPRTQETLEQNLRDVSLAAVAEPYLAEEFVSRLYYEKGMTYFDASMDYGDVVALEAIMLQVSFSFFNQLGPNTWFLVGTAARLALGMGLHCDSTYSSLSTIQAIRRKRLFLSIYMMDRLVSITLGRPFAIHEDDIDISSFAIETCEELDNNLAAPQSNLCKSSMAVTEHILRLRKIATEIATKVYCKRVVAGYSAAQREQVVSGLHQDLVNWRQSVPFPLPHLHANVPHGCTTWFDLNFYTHMMTLYRPSPLFPTLPVSHVNTLAEAAACALRQANSMRLQKRLAFNWLNLLMLYNAVIALVYSVTVQPEKLAESLERLHAVEDLQLAMEMFEVLGDKFPAAKTIGAMVAQVVE